VKKSRTTEAVGHLNKEWAGSLSYYETDTCRPAARRCPSNSPAPRWLGLHHRVRLSDRSAVPGQCPAWGSDPVWLALNFSIPDSHNYMPGYSGSGTGTASQFTAYAKGDLNCNSTLATFVRSGV